MKFTGIPNAGMKRIAQSFPPDQGEEEVVELLNEACTALQSITIKGVYGEDAGKSSADCLTDEGVALIEQAFYILNGIIVDRDQMFK